MAPLHKINEAMAGEKQGNFSRQPKETEERNAQLHLISHDTQSTQFQVALQSYLAHSKKAAGAHLLITAETAESSCEHWYSSTAPHLR